MIYFAYNANMVTYLLCKGIGEVEVIGMAKLAAHKFLVNKRSGDRSLKANIVQSDNLEDYVYGVAYKIDPIKKRKLDRIEQLDRDYQVKQSLVEVFDGSFCQAIVYYAKADRPVKNFPYDCYMNLIITGATEHSLPQTYITFLNRFRTKKDFKSARTAMALALLDESRLPRKHL